MPAETNIGVRLRAERLARHMTVQALAEAFREAVSERERRRMPQLRDLCRTIRGHEAGEHPPGPRYQMLYATAFDLPVEELFGPDDAGRSLWRLPGVELNGAFTPDDEDRLVRAVTRPSRLDAEVVEALSAVLTGQRRLEDAVGPAAMLGPVGMQTGTITAMLRDASGPHRDALGRITAEWMTFSGWLHAATRRDTAALALFGGAEELADEVGYGAVAALATSFRGYVARKQGRPRAIIRAAAAAAATPGTHPAQETFDVLQEAQARATLGERDTVRRMLDKAAHLAEGVGEPPPFGYWYTTAFFRLNIGVAQLRIGEHRDAADMIGSGLAAMPVEQRRAEWAQEYERTLTEARTG